MRRSLYLLSWKVAPALAMGNTVVAKPSEQTPRTATVLADIIRTTRGLPPGMFNLVHGYGSEVGNALVGHRDVHLVSFTGGTATGRKVAQTAGPMFKARASAGQRRPRPWPLLTLHPRPTVPLRAETEPGAGR